jgi:hypothetical protein
MILTDRTDRPRVSKLLHLPWECFAQARPGARVTPGAQGPRAPSGGGPPRGTPAAGRATPVESRRATRPRPTSGFL